MTAQDILNAWNRDAKAITTIQSRPDRWFQVTLPFSTLSDKLISIYVRKEFAGWFTISDHRDLINDAYEVRDNESALPFMQANDLLGRGHFANINEAGGVFTRRVDHLQMLSSAMFDFAQFIQLAVNLAVLQTENEAVIAPHTY